MKRYIRISAFLNEWAGKLVSFLVIPMILFIMTEIFLRYAFNLPTMWVHETTRYLLTAVVVIGGGYTLLHRSHVVVDIIYSRFSPRGKALVDILLTWTLFGLFCGMLFWHGLDLQWSP